VSHLKAHLLLKSNIDALLFARGLNRKDLAAYCRRSESWLSQIFRDPERNMPLKYLDRIADFFGIATYQLFQPGLSSRVGERRSGRERRSGMDRRISRATELLDVVPNYAELEQQIRRLSPDEYRRFLRRATGALALEDRKPSGITLPDPPAADARQSATATRTRGRRRGTARGNGDAA
jgi:transcriptional regulator with XRE-family HTH domain